MFRRPQQRAPTADGGVVDVEQDIAPELLARRAGMYRRAESRVGRSPFSRTRTRQPSGGVAVEPDTKPTPKRSTSGVQRSSVIATAAAAPARPAARCRWCGDTRYSQASPPSIACRAAAADRAARPRRATTIAWASPGTSRVEMSAENGVCPPSCSTASRPLTQTESPCNRPRRNGAGAGPCDRPRSISISRRYQTTG